MRLRIFRIEQCCLFVGVEGTILIAGFKHVAQGKPCASLSFGNMRCWFQLGGGAQELFGVGLVCFDQHQTKIQIGFEDARFGSDRLAIGRDRIVGLA